MLGILALLAGTLSVGLAMIPSGAGGGGGGDEGSDVSSIEEQNLENYTDEGDLIVSSEHEDVLDAVLAEVEETLLDPEYLDGALRVSAGDGGDVVVGGSEADIIAAGDGDDLVAGGAGNDRIDLGAGDDTYGLSPFLEDYDADHLAALGVLELGNDTVRGGVGDDSLSDRFGTNRLIGNQGDDLLVGLDDASEEMATPDILLGGFGHDHIHADEGDTVVAGRGLDVVTLHLPPTVGDTAPAPIVIEDFFRNVDTLEIEGLSKESDIAIRDMADGSGAELLLDGHVVARVIGGAGLTLAEVMG